MAIDRFSFADPFDRIFLRIEIIRSDVLNSTGINGEIAISEIDFYDNLVRKNKELLESISSTLPNDK